MQKIISGPPFFAKEICVNPAENYIDSLFRGKIGLCVFFQPPPPLSDFKFSRPPVCISPPLSVCELSLTYK